jgi:hypothetical protein
MKVIVEVAGQPIGAGASMSPGSQIRALTAKRARPNKATIRIGRMVLRKKLTVTVFKPLWMLIKQQDDCDDLAREVRGK